jgi:hypothetical protein
MKLKRLVIACCVSLSGMPAFAQAGGAAADPLSGTWVGDMAPQGETSRTNVTMELKFDGSSAVSGTVTGPPSPGHIKTGTFDPKSGTLKLEVQVQDADTLFVFDGTVLKGVATGRVSGNNRTGDFKLTKKAAGAQTAAPQPAPNDPAAALRKSFGEVSGWVTRSADLVPADKYTYKPTESVRSFGQVIAHVADSYNYYCARAAGRDVKWSDPIEKGGLDKATLVPRLKQALDTCTAAYGANGKVDVLIENLGHTNLHYGNIITYMRMLGLVPPSS